ncbi:unnamed protein product [Caenorhabditis bovis]|uniref:Uncharacterized protein n=1 Tax=Caenorhabditis bovis TaxID=2654633 RepID=A0A8S1EQ44_9PELO|nr:unnamed protein product [Caenorhabditis bovis]
MPKNAKTSLEIVESADGAIAPPRMPKFEPPAPLPSLAPAAPKSARLKSKVQFDRAGIDCRFGDITYVRTACVMRRKYLSVPSRYRADDIPSDDYILLDLVVPAVLGVVALCATLVIIKHFIIIDERRELISKTQYNMIRRVEYVKFQAKKKQEVLSGK